MKLIIKTLALLLLMPLFSVAQTTTDAQKIIDEVKAHYNAEYEFEADFIIEIDIPEAQNTQMEGVITIDGDKFKYTSPELTVISDNVNIWFWTKTATIDEVQVSHVDSSQDVVQPSKVFSYYLDGFDNKLISHKTFDERKLALLELTPENKSDDVPYFKVKVTVDTDKDSIDQLEVYYKDGTVYRYMVKNEVEKHCPAGTFTFDIDANPNTEIIDLR